ncbi:MAG: pyridoxal phosphate-dependent aminotransferase, partial [Candidatus Aminicenantales bacterium]
MKEFSSHRRRFLGSLLACGAAITWNRSIGISPLKAAPRPVKRINWGYPEGAVRLNKNENPLGPSPRALNAMAEALHQAHRYTSSQRLIEELASFHSISKDMVLAGCGSTEFLRIAPWTFLRNGGELVTGLQTYQTLIRECRRIGIGVHTLPLGKDFTFDLDYLKKAVSQATRMVYIVNPNNPTGTCLDFEEVEKFCASLPTPIIVFIDEAYAQFLEDRQQRDGITLVKKGYNVIVSRTFSKVHGLAGMRLGYVVSTASNIEELKKFSLRSMWINKA